MTVICQVICLRRSFPNRVALFQKTRSFNKFPWEQKRRIKKFFDCKRIWKTQEKIKFQFIQEPWINLLVKSPNSQIFYIINIMNFNKLAQELHLYLRVASFYFSQSKLKSLIIHSFNVLMNDFKSSSSKGNKRKVAFSNVNIFFGDSSPMLKSCWIHS